LRRSAAIVPSRTAGVGASLIASIGLLTPCISIGLSASAYAATEIPNFQPAPCQLVDLPPDWARENPVNCGWVTVPAHHNSKDTAVLKLWVFRIRAYDNSAPGGARGVIRMVGGPIPRLQNMATLDSLATRLSRRTHDVIFFDYRGVGRESRSSVRLIP
jgi:hypothetical protein